ncbi:Cytochrome-c oxidase [Thermocrinis albus DSM 14484]|uniref:Cytochrome-c oxidase n=1 Tax=Thermocrinis albus (strain DSM 14484 / JCM 11386 / HI 11/12) TaxID=638303 RepID=D3SN06_THEAH|nr:cbb3-type cytochrome c oxidase subunit I [Thermocrinis albus]ADC90136.1 Cytochrome-c oxidase [Thermocrinis albus DSM 14484]
MAVAGVHRPWFGATLKEWIFTTDHKKIGVMYGVTSLLFFLIAGISALGIRLELFQPGLQYMDEDTYNALLTTHGVLMQFWWAVGVWSSFGNFLLPLMIGARDVAFPRLNALSYWFFFSASVLAVLTLLPGNHIRMMWTGYPPISLNDNVGQVAYYAFIIHLLGASSLATAVNLVVTNLRMRAPGITLGKMNLFLHAFLAMNVIQILGVPALAGAVTMLLLDKYFHTAFFDPSRGGDPILYQNIFWFYSHPVVYVMVLPAFGVISEIVATFSRREIFGRKSMIAAIWGIAILGFMVWIHHMFTSGIPDWIKIIFSYTTVLIGVPTGIKIFNWVATLYKGSIRYTTPMLYILSAIFMFLIGGLTGIPLGLPAFDINVQDSHFVVGHFHYVLGMTVTLVAFGGFFYWFPKVTGRMYSEFWGKVALVLIMVGSNLFYFLQLIVGLEGMPRRYADYPPIPQWITLHELQTVGAFILAVGVGLAVLNLVLSAKFGPKAPDNPWESPSLEWLVPSPPPPHNFDKIPHMPEDWDPYNYEWLSKHKKV